jgi:aromatic ring-cleaving dioxygenase
LEVDNWIIGFINGEGSFYLNKDKCNFYIEHTDRQLLELIRYRLGFGPNVLERSARERDIGKVRKPMYRLNISSKKDLNELVMFLDNKDNMPLQGYKMVQYNKWKEALN